MIFLEPNYTLREAISLLTTNICFPALVLHIATQTSYHSMFFSSNQCPVHLIHGQTFLFRPDCPQSYLVRNEQSPKTITTPLPTSPAPLQHTYLFVTPTKTNPQTLPLTKYSVSDVRHESEFTAHTLHKPQHPVLPQLPASLAAISAANAGHKEETLSRVN